MTSRTRAASGVRSAASCSPVEVTMKHKTWFRLVMKVIGIALIAWSVPDVFQVLAWYVEMGRSDRWSAAPGGGMETVDYILRGVYLLSPSIRLAFGLYLLFGGEWLINKIIPSNRPYCPECGYDLSHARDERCPECGIVLPAGTAASEDKKDE